MQVLQIFFLQDLQYLALNLAHSYLASLALKNKFLARSVQDLYFLQNASFLVHDLQDIAMQHLLHDLASLQKTIFARHAYFLQDSS